jgi:CubicO group peptidase (beta-lactamase class C family)
MDFYSRHNVVALQKILLLALLALSGIVSAAPPDVDSLDEYFSEAREDWKVPGMAVAIIKNGQILLAKGYGVKEMGKPDPVDADTLFAIASNSKAFTAAAISILVDEGKLNWDDRVRNYLPYFRLYDPYVSNEIRIRDLLCHRSGLGTFSGDLLWYLTDYSAEEVVRRARFLAPQGVFRGDYGYSNLMFIAAGEVIRKVSGNSWSDFVSTRILEPLDMKRTLTSAKEISRSCNVASPHSNLFGELSVFPWVSWEASAAAAGIISSANDMAKWIELQLRAGTAPAEEIFSEESNRIMRTLHLSLPVSSASRKLYPSTHFRGYGLGWSLFDYLGKKVVTHGGAYDGMFSRVALVPEENIGIVILTNGTTSLQTALMYRFLDSFLSGEGEDWSKVYLELARRRGEAKLQKVQKLKNRRSVGTSPSLEPGAYTGTYGGDLYGEAKVWLEDGKLVLQLQPAPELIGDLTHWHYDTYRIQWRRDFPWFGDGTVQFLFNKYGDVTEFVLDVPNDDFWFTELEFKKRRKDTN